MSLTGHYIRRKYFVPAFLFFVTAGLSGCSWMAEFFVFNKTSESVVVRYTLANQDTTHNAFQVKAYRIEGWNDSVPVLGDTVAIYSRREAGSRYYIELPANTAVTIAGDMNLDMKDAEQRLRLLDNVRDLTILSPNDALFSCNDSSCNRNISIIGTARAGIVFGN